MKVTELAVSSLALSALLLAGCSDEGESQSPAVTATPSTATDTLAMTPTEEAPSATEPNVGDTATPSGETDIPDTPVPGSYNQGYRTDSWIISSTNGQDLDGDGSVDNNFVAVYDISVSIIGDSIYTATYDFCILQGANESDCVDAGTSAKTIFIELMSVENLNVLIEGAIQSDLLNFAETLTGESEAADFEWFSARGGLQDQYVLEESIGLQSGTVADDGSAAVGPATIVYDFSDIYGLLEEFLELSGEAILQVEESHSTFVYTPAALTGGDIGGYVSQDGMLNFMKGLIPIAFCSPQTQECTEFDILADTLVSLEGAYTDPANADLWIELNSDGVLYTAVGFGFSASEATLVTEIVPPTGGGE